MTRILVHTMVFATICILAGCTSTPEATEGSLNDQWGQDTRVQRREGAKDRKIKFSSEVDVMRDTDEKRGW